MDISSIDYLSLSFKVNKFAPPPTVVTVNNDTQDKVVRQIPDEATLARREKMSIIDIYV